MMVAEIWASRICPDGSLEYTGCVGSEASTVHALVEGKYGAWLVTGLVFMPERRIRLMPDMAPKLGIKPEAVSALNRALDRALALGL